MDVLSIIILILVFNINYIESSATGCNWNLNKDIPKNDPLYIKLGTKPELLLPNSTGISLDVDEKIGLTCTGKSNIISNIGLQNIIATCSNNELIFNDKNYTLKSLECKKSVLSILETNTEECSEGILYKIGFNTVAGPIYLIDVCYSQTYDIPFYSIHTINGNSLEGAEKDSYRPYFQTNGLIQSKLIFDVYKRKGQLNRFIKIFGEELGNKYINNKNFLSRGHLAPDGDFIFGSWSHASYYLVNVAPQWQSVNGGNWQRVESLIRKLASKIKTDLKIFTGVHDVLQLPDEYGNLTCIHLLDDFKLPVPKYYWKIVYNPVENEGIVFVTMNNPYATVIRDDDVFCRNICEETNWYRKKWKSFKSGFTFCCNVNEFTRTVKSLSHLSLNVTKNLFGSF